MFHAAGLDEKKKSETISRLCGNERLYHDLQGVRQLKIVSRSPGCTAIKDCITIAMVYGNQRLYHDLQDVRQSKIVSLLRHQKKEQKQKKSDHKLWTS